jgi:glutamyl-tRNA reductase
MVLGEREIITQVRNAYNFSRDHALSGDTIRIVIRQTIETAKRVYTETSIAEKSVSVVSLAYQELMKAKLPIKSKILIIGSGVTNQNLTRFLKKDGYSNLVVFNRSLENAKKFVSNFSGEAHALKDLADYRGGFDVILTCTSSKDPVITKAIYGAILANKKQKTIVDLAVPNDVAENVYAAFPVRYVSVESLKERSEKNLLERKKELLKARQIIFDSLEAFKSIFEMRQIEIKMREIPQHVKAIRAQAMTEVFSKEVDELDENSKAILDKILNYMEKKYVSVPMIMAKEMLIKSK